MALPVVPRLPSSRWPGALASAEAMYSDATNVNEARKALWDKGFRALSATGVALWLL